MIIQCPNCAVAYDIDAAVLGTKGRRLRCSACGHAWHQAGPSPAVTPFPAMLAPAGPASPPVTDVLADTAKLSLQPLDSRTASVSPGVEPWPNTAATAAAESPSRADIATPAPEPSAPATESDARAAAFAPPTGAAGPGATPPARPITSAEPERRRSVARLSLGAAAVAVTLIAVLVIALLTLRDTITAGLPGAAEWYARAGFGDGGLGAGLDIREVTTARRDGPDGGETLVVAGAVVNVADARREVPRIRVGLVDDADAELQSVVVAPLKGTLDPGERLSFAAVVERPATTVRKVKVTFAP